MPDKRKSTGEKFPKKAKLRVDEEPDEEDTINANVTTLENTVNDSNTGIAAIADALNHPEDGLEAKVTALENAVNHPVTGLVAISNNAMVLKAQIQNVTARSVNKTRRNFRGNWPLAPIVKTIPGIGVGIPGVAPAPPLSVAPAVGTSSPSFPVSLSDMMSMSRSAIQAQSVYYNEDFGIVKKDRTNMMLKFQQWVCGFYPADALK